jgi:O-methyltransferase involved in polyketide biosynthesis
MTDKINTSQLGKIQETLIIPLLGRVQVSKRNSGFFYDKKALEIIKKLDYDFSKFDAAFPTLEGAVLRTRVMDKWLSELLELHPTTCIVELGCGLNTRCDRLDNGQAMWFDLDLPDVQQIWKHFFKETSRRKFLPFSAFDDAWVKEVKSNSEGPYVFIMEGSVVYFEEQKVQGLWKMIADNFPNSHLIFDSVNSAWVKQQNSNHAMKAVEARLKWAIDDIYDIENWNKRYRILKHENLLFPSSGVRKIYPWWILASTPFAKLIFGDAVSGYFVNMGKVR